MGGGLNITCTIIVFRFGEYGLGGFRWGVRTYSLVQLLLYVHIWRTRNRGLQHGVRGGLKAMYTHGLRSYSKSSLRLCYE